MILNMGRICVNNKSCLCVAYSHNIRCVCLQVAFCVLLRTTSSGVWLFQVVDTLYPSNEEVISYISSGDTNVEHHKSVALVGDIHRQMVKIQQWAATENIANHLYATAYYSNLGK